MYKSVEVFKEPLYILEKMEESCAEMTPAELGFLCGLIKIYHPEKVLEVGVAGGGTTSVIMKCLSMTGSRDAEMYSVDLSEEYYRRPEKRTGWQLEEVKDDIENYKNHTFLLGKLLPQVVHEIGGEIDMVVLDTMHIMPGEMLDFLCILPHLAKNAIVVLHDIIMNLLTGGNCFATKVLLDSVSGEKYLNLDCGLQNIGAFRITEETMQNIENVFSALSVTWDYFVEPKMLISYRESFRPFYPERCLKLFDQIVWRQYQCYGRYKADVDNEIMKFQKICSSGEKLYLYGAGIRGNQLKSYILQQGYQVNGFIISDNYEPNDFANLDPKTREKETRNV